MAPKSKLQYILITALCAAREGAASAQDSVAALSESPALRAKSRIPAFASIAPLRGPPTVRGDSTPIAIAQLRPRPPGCVAGWGSPTLAPARPRRVMRGISRAVAGDDFLRCRLPGTVGQWQTEARRLLLAGPAKCGKFPTFRAILRQGWGTEMVACGPVARPTVGPRSSRRPAGSDGPAIGLRLIVAPPNLRRPGGRPWEAGCRWRRSRYPEIKNRASSRADSAQRGAQFHRSSNSARGASTRR